MPVRINNLKLSVEQNEGVLLEQSARLLGINKNNIISLNIIKESVDARRKNNINFVYSVLLSLNINEENAVYKTASNDIAYLPPHKQPMINKGMQKLKNRPVVVGCGPAGLFSALLLAKNGYNPIVIERGSDVDKRAEKVEQFWKMGNLDVNDNVQFGEGGAGTFSDGKLTTRINDPLCSEVLKQLVEFGAPNEIIYRAKPHIGTDLLRTVVKNIRAEIEKLGGEVRFNTKLTDIDVKNGVLRGIYLNDGDFLSCNALILAIGHSARDTYQMLLNNGINLTQKAFSVGVRIEHPQSVLNKAQYGDLAGHPRLKPAEYQLSYRENQRACYSFCMCPGGLVIASSSEEGGVVTNGMSSFARAEENANSAICISIDPTDFENSHPLAGIEFQRKLEKLAFKYGGGNYSAPVQLVGDYLENKISTNFGEVIPSYTPKTAFADLRQCLPNFAGEILANGLRYFDTRIKGFAMPHALMTGVETRTSAPVRITRDDTFQAIGINGLYPSGEGAGYAGGIMSAAVDGLKTAYKIIERFSAE